MIRTTENRTGYELDHMVQIAQRENNTKRGYLLVNRFQAKHVPVSPGTALELFDRLGSDLYEDLKDSKVLFIGFAETATAIGARIAAQFAGDGYYIQTTREDMDPAFAVVTFREEHSHATKQQLFSRDKEILADCDVIVFVEDEVTTGKTILNFIAVLEERGIRDKFCVASLLNSMDEDSMARYRQKGIAVYYLAKLINDFDFAETVNAVPTLAPSEDEDIIVTEVKGRMEPRLGVKAKEYEKACRALGEEILPLLPRDGYGDNILVLGTEECMYPAISAAKVIEEKRKGAKTAVHATTRSPIVPSDQKGYPLYSRVQLDSLYEKERGTFLYNIEKYDCAVIVTDAPDINLHGLKQLVSALRYFGTETIIAVKWVE